MKLIAPWPTLRRGLARAALLAFAATATAFAEDSPRIRLAGHLPDDGGAAEVAGDPPDALTLTLVLRRDDEAGFRRYLHDVYDAASPEYRRFLGAAQLADRFGPAPASVAAVAAYFAGHGFTTVEAPASRMTLTLRAARRDVEAALDLRVAVRARGDRRYYANDAEPALPAAVATHVQSIAGLSDLARVQPLTQAQPPHYYQCPQGVDPAYCDLYGPLCAIYAGARATGELLQDLEGTGKGLRDYAKAFNTHNENVQDYYEKCLANEFDRADAAAVGEARRVPVVPAGGSVPWSQVDGSGQTIGLVAFDAYHDGDIANYLQLIGAPPSQMDRLGVVYVGGGASFGAAESEVVLDIDTVMGLAPGADVVVYSAPFDGAGSSFQRVFDRMVSDGVDVISNSWAYCEDQTTRADVEGIDAILQTAAAAGISVYSGSGDSGSTCLDGAADTIAVPADAPHATAVGGTSLRAGAGGVYVDERWWDSSQQSPPGGQGGFGLSRYFTRPAYQDGFVTAAKRSIPDVSAQADPASGMTICQASAGGCPTGLLYGGTSLAVPIWGAFTALLNQARGSNLGSANASLYPLAASGGFHDAASMGSDFAHVGLGSPNLGALNLLLRGIASGVPDANVSELLATAPPVAPFTTEYGVPADGTTPGVVIVTLRDADGNSVPGKTVTLAAGAGSHATIAPASVTTRADGVAVFKVTDLFAEELVLTATDTSDGVVLARQAKLLLIVPAASAGGVVAFPTTQAADGASTVTVTVTLHDALGRPAAGKQVALAQDAHALVLGQNPATTGANGEAVFGVTDQVAETVGFSARNLTDGDLAVPGDASATFSNGVGCGASASPVAAPGYKVSLYASGFPTQNGVTWGGITVTGCVGIGGLAFDAAGHLYASDYVSGDVYDVPPGGATVGTADRITPTPLGPSLGALTLGHDGNLYGVRLATTGDFTTGAVLRINLGTGVATPVASGLTCPFNIATDPLSGDLFVDDGCYGNGADDASIWRVSNPGGATPTTDVYATSGGAPNGGLSFAADGTLYVVHAYNSVVAAVDRIGSTAQPQPPAVQSTGIYSTFAVTALGSAPGGGARALVVGDRRSGGYPYSVAAWDMTVSPPVFSGATLEETGAGAQRIVGPDGCLYLNAGVAIYRLANADDSCPLAAQLSPDPSIVVEPQMVPPAGEQGTPQYFRITFPHTNVPVGTPVTIVVSGANALQQVAYVGFGGDAGFVYAGREAGTDTLVAYATVEGELLVSNRVRVEWSPGRHASWINLDASPDSGDSGSMLHAVASLFDVSLDPPAPIAARTLAFTLGNGGCDAVTDVAGIARCDIPLAAVGVYALSASFAGDAGFLPATASSAVRVLRDSIFADGFDAP